MSAKRGRTAGIATTGRKTRPPHRIEIWFHNLNLDSRSYLTGLPGKSGRYANLRANPEFTFHLKSSARADIPTRPTPILAESQRWVILERITLNQGRQSALEAWLGQSHLVELTFT